jgi:twitching motility two-component system response regulator PilG
VTSRPVVVIDDSPTIRKIMELVLSRLGLRMVGADTGVTGLAAVAQHNPALIFVDVVLPRLNGYQICQVIKRHPRYRNTPVVMLSGRDGVFDKVRGRLAGADGYITKPFELRSVVAVVQEHLRPAGAVAQRLPVGSKEASVAGGSLS